MLHDAGTMIKHMSWKVKHPAVFSLHGRKIREHEQQVFRFTDAGHDLGSSAVTKE